MKIAYNPKDVTPLTGVSSDSQDIIFDLSGMAIYARGIKFSGTDTTYEVFTSTTTGLVPVPGNDNSNRFLRGDGTWAIPAGSSYNVMTLEEAIAGTSTDSRVITAKVLHDKISSTTYTSDHITTLTGYSKPESTSDINSEDSLNTALGKLEVKADTAYKLITAANDEDGTIENLVEILEVLNGIKDTDTILAIVGKYLPLSGGTMTGHIRLSNRAYIYTNVGSYAILGMDGQKYILAAPNYPTTIRSNGTLKHNDAIIWDSSTLTSLSQLNNDADFTTNAYVNETFVTSNALNDYLPLSGGTLTGQLTIKSSSNSGSTPKLYFRRGTTTDNYWDTYIYNKSGGLIFGYSYSGTNYDLVAVTSAALQPNSDNTYNLGASDYKWNNVYTTLINGGTPWHSGNDGADSGLDADLLDGLHCTDFVRNYGTVGANYSKGCWLGYTYSREEHGAPVAGGVISAGVSSGMQIVGHHGGSYLYYRGIDGQNFTEWKQIAFIDSDIIGNAASADKVKNSLILKINSGTTEGTSLYTYNGSAEKTLDIKQGSNVTLTTAANSLTIAASDTKVTQTNTTGSASYRVLFSGNDNDTTETTTARKSSKLLFNPSTGILTTGHLSTGGDIIFTGSNKNQYLYYYHNDAWAWRTGHQGTGTSDTNYFVIQNQTSGTITTALKIDYNAASKATFIGTVVAPTFQGNIDGTYVNKLTGYTKAESPSDLTATDTLNIALGKLEYKAAVAYSWYRSITEDDTDDIINKWDEVVDFVNNMSTDLTDEFVTRKTNLTITGIKTFKSANATTVLNGGSVISSLNINGGWARGFNLNNTSGDTTISASFGVYGDGAGSDGTSSNKINYLYLAHQDQDHTTATFKVYGDKATILNNEVYHKGNLKNLSDLNDDLLSGKYLPLTGGRLQGSTNTPLSLRGVSTDTWIAYYSDTGSFFGSIGVSSDNHPYFYYTGAKQKIWHSGNFNPSNYLSLSGGGTITGDLFLKNTYFMWQMPSNGNGGYFSGQSFNAHTNQGYTAQIFTWGTDGILTFKSTPKVGSNTIWHSGNDGSGSSLDADLLDGFNSSYGNNKPWGTIPVITAGGYMDVGKHFEFHYDNTTDSDYSTALMCTGNHSNIVNLPSQSGTLALLTDNIASATNADKVDGYHIEVKESSAGTDTSTIYFVI